jgi:hypothetical protein
MEKQNWNLGNSIKQGFSESIINWYFNVAGFKVYSFGYERVLSGIISSNVKIKNSPSYDRLRTMPDFIVVDHKGELLFVEVKYRKKYDPSKIRWKKIYQFWPETLIVVVTPEERPYIRACYAKEIVNKKASELKLLPLSNYLSFKENKGFDIIQKEVAKLFEEKSLFEIFEFLESSQKVIKINSYIADAYVENNYDDDVDNISDYEKEYRVDWNEYTSEME